MTDNNNYILRVAAASPAELVIISYDIMLECIDAAIQCHKTDPEGFIENVNRAKDALGELTAALDMDNSVAKELYPLYVHINTLFMSALVYEKRDKLDEALQLLSILREGWVRAGDSAPPGDSVYRNAPRVFSGLTYDKYGPSDYVDADPDRGIRA